MRFLTAGETHGKKLTAIIEGFPSGVPIDFARINNELRRRQCGYGRGGRMKIECDRIEITSGVRGGISTGAPISIEIENKDFENWKEGMDAEEGDRAFKPLLDVRPGHADLAGVQKYHYPDARYVLERASARETAARTAVGAIAKELLYALGIEIGSHVLAIGGIRSAAKASRASETTIAEKSLVHTLDEKAAEFMMKEIDRARERGDTLGGEIEVVISGVKAGVGSHVHYDRKLDYKIMGAVGSIQAVKAVAIGEGFNTGNMHGHLAHDEIYAKEGNFFRAANNAGGIEGGISNGESIIVRAIMKPIPTLMKGLNTVRLTDMSSQKAAAERSDVCAVPALCVVAENVVAFVLADAVLETLGGDYLEEIIERYAKK